MRALVLFAHPVETSFNAALHRTTVAALTEAGYEVDDCDLYAEGFDPVMSRQERRHTASDAVRRKELAPAAEPAAIDRRTVAQ